MQVKPGNAPQYYQLESRASEYSSFFYEHDYYLQSLRYWNVERIKRKSIAKIPLDLSFYIGADKILQRSGKGLPKSAGPVAQCIL